MTTKLLVDLPPVTAQRLEEAAENRAASKGGLVRQALDAFLPQLDDENENRRFLVTLSDDAARTLAAFRESRDYPKRDRLVERALLKHIESESADLPVETYDETSRRFQVTLTEPASEMVDAFRDALDYPKLNVLVERALLSYIQARCYEDPLLRDRVEEAKGSRVRTRIRAISDGRKR